MDDAINCDLEDILDICVSPDALQAAAIYLEEVGWNIFECECDAPEAECQCVDIAVGSLRQAIAIAMRVQTIETMTDRVVSRGSRVIH
jgi:hypothetical protein